MAAIPLSWNDPIFCIGNSGSVILRNGDTISNKSITTNVSGAWSFETTDLANGGHNFTSKAMDAAVNTSSASGASGIITVSEPATAPTTASIDFTNLYEGWNDTATIKGTANAFSQIKLFDGTESLGLVKAGSGGSWSFKTSALSDTVHTFSAQQNRPNGRDESGQGHPGLDPKLHCEEHDWRPFNRGQQRLHTFVLADTFGNDTIKDFEIKDFEANYAVGGRHDTSSSAKACSTTLRGPHEPSWSRRCYFHLQQLANG